MLLHNRPLLSFRRWARARPSSSASVSLAVKEKREGGKSRRWTTMKSRGTMETKKKKSGERETERGGVEKRKEKTF